MASTIRRQALRRRNHLRPSGPPLPIDPSIARLEITPIRLAYRIGRSQFFGLIVHSDILPITGTVTGT